MYIYVYVKSKEGKIVKQRKAIMQLSKEYFKDRNRNNNGIRTKQGG